MFISTKVYFNVKLSKATLKQKCSTFRLLTSDGPKHHEYSTQSAIYYNAAKINECPLCANILISEAYVSLASNDEK